MADEPKKGFLEAQEEMGDKAHQRLKEIKKGG